MEGKEKEKTYITTCYCPVSDIHVLRVPGVGTIGVYSAPLTV